MLLSQVPESLREALDVPSVSPFHSFAQLGARGWGWRCWRQRGRGSSRTRLTLVGTQQISSSHLSVSQQCHPPYLSPSFQGQAKLFLLTAPHKGWALLITMMMLAIYLPASWRLQRPQPAAGSAPACCSWRWWRVGCPAQLGGHLNSGSGRMGDMGSTDITGLWNVCGVCLQPQRDYSEGLHPRVLISPQGGFTWEQKAFCSLSEDNWFWQTWFNAFLQHWWGWAGLCSAPWEEEPPWPLLLGSGSELASFGLWNPALCGQTVQLAAAWVQSFVLRSLLPFLAAQLKFFLLRADTVWVLRRAIVVPSRASGTGVTYILQRGDSREILFLPKSFGDQLSRGPGDHNLRHPNPVGLVWQTLLPDTCVHVCI